MNGGSGIVGQLTFDLVYGTFSLGGSSFDYLATNTPLIVDDQGNDLLTAVSLTPGLDPRVYSGITVLLGSPMTPVTVTFPLMECGALCTPIAWNVPLSANQTVDNTAFSTGALGQISDVTDPSQVLAEAELLHLISAGAASTSTPRGSLLFATTVDQLVGNLVEVATLSSTIDLQELDFTGTAIAGAAVPEPSDFWPALICAGIVAFANSKRYRALLAATTGDERETN